jgi:hypothetical protein
MWRKLETCDPTTTQVGNSRHSPAPANRPKNSTFIRPARRWWSGRSVGQQDFSIQKITLMPLKSQIDDTIELCRERVEEKERVLVTTLTKCTAKDLAGYLI